MSLRHKVPFRAGELPVDNLGLEIDSRPAAPEVAPPSVFHGYNCIKVRKNYYFLNRAGSAS